MICIYIKFAIHFSIMFFTAFPNLTSDVVFPCHIFLDCRVSLLPNIYFLCTNCYLIKVEMNDIKVKIRTDMNDRPHITHGKVGEVSIFLPPDILQQEKKTINSNLGSD